MSLSIALTSVLILVGGIWIVGNIIRQVFEMLMRISLLIAAGGMLVAAYLFLPQLSAVVPQLEQLSLVTPLIPQLPENLIETTVTEEYIDYSESTPRDAPTPPMVQDSIVPSAETIEPPRTVQEYTRPFPKRGSGDNEEETVPSTTNELKTIAHADCEQPFPVGHWVVAVAFFGQITNIWRYKDSLKGAGFENIADFRAACYDTNIGSRKGHLHLSAVTVGPAWETQADAEIFAERIRTAAIELDFDLKTIRPVYLGIPKNQE